MTKGSLSSAGLVVMLGFLLIVNSVQILHLGESIIIDDETSTGALSEEMLKERAQQVVEAQFYENLGQIQNNDIRFYGDVAGLGIGFTDSGVVYRISSRVEESQENIVDITQSESIFVTLRFEGANEVTLHGNGLLPHKSNYFIGNNLDEWHTDVCSYSEIVYPDLYNNIDLIYRVSEGGLKYEFIVWPGGDPSDINLHYEGIDGLSVDQDGALVASTAYGPLVDGGLYIYQVTESGQMEIEGEFKRGHEDRFDFGFQIAGNYCKAMPLVIDPFLHYSTFVGGSSNDDGYSITLDSSNNAYVTGYTQSANFPTTPGANDTSHNGNYDVFILKLSADGSTLLYSTFVGSSDGEGGYSIALDSSDNAYVTGYTQSANFPTTPGANDTSHNGNIDVFILKLSADGSSLLYSTFVGESDDDRGRSIALDSSNNAYVTGLTQSANFPTTPGANDTSQNGGYDGFALKLSADGSTLLYSTFVGGSSDDYVRSIALDSLDNVYVTGETYSNSFPTTPGANDTSHNGGADVFILKLSADGSTLLYSTFVGGSSNDYVRSIALDSSDNAYVTGYTQSANFPTTPGANDTSHNGNNDVFILKLSADGSSLLYSTFVGGSSDDYVRSIALDSSDNAYVTGYTDSSNFPTTHGANDTSHNGGSDVFIVKIDFRPMITIYGPTNTTYADDFVSIDYAITTSENYATEILLDGVSNSTAVPSGSLWSDLSDGSHNLTIIVTISNGDYAIETTIFSIDLTAPDVDSPMDITYLVNSAHFYVDWTVGDRTPGWYKVEGNGSTIGLTSWSENGTISFSIDSLAAGLVYNHTITVYDALGHSVTDTVFVRVVERTELSSPMDVTIEFGSTGNYLTWTIGNIWWPLPSYRIDGNATTVEWTACTDETIVLSIDGLDVGVWNFTVMTMDQYGYNTTDTVFVMVVDTIAPIIDSPLGIVYNETDTGNIITWTPSDLRPESYEIFRNGSSIESRTWDGSAIPRNVDGLTAGVYNYTLVVRDSSGNTGFDTVMVVVLALTSTTTTTTVTTTETTSTTSTTDTTTPPPDNTLLVIGIGGAGVGAVIVVIMLILKRRKL